MGFWGVAHREGFLHLRKKLRTIKRRCNGTRPSGSIGEICVEESVELAICVPDIVLVVHVCDTSTEARLF